MNYNREISRVSVYVCARTKKKVAASFVRSLKLVHITQYLYKTIKFIGALINIQDQRHLTTQHMSVLLRRDFQFLYVNELFNEIFITFDTNANTHARVRCARAHTRIRSLELCIFDRWNRFRSILLFL